MRHLIFVITAFLSFITSAQSSYSLRVDYEYQVIPRTSPFNIQYGSKLIASENESLYEIDLKREDSTLTIMSPAGSYRMIKPKSNSFYYKNFKTNVLINKERVLTKKFVVVDNLDIFNWEIKSERKTILGYKCQKATTHFRGYDYTVYFAPEIPVNDGPWKMNGLPGLILLAEKDDGSFRLEAKAIKILNETVNISNPYKGEENISRLEFEELYTKKYHEMNNFTEENDGVTVSRSMPKGAIELIVKE